jgi:ABC-type Fe3+ transport system permease subunit
VTAPATYGTLDQVLALLGADEDSWLLSYPWPVPIVADGLVGTSLATVLFSAVIRAVPQELLLTAAADGASYWQAFRYVVLPLSLCRADLHADAEDSLMARRPSRGVRLAAALLALMLPLLVLYAWLPVAAFSRRAVGLRPEKGLTLDHWARPTGAHRWGNAAGVAGQVLPLAPDVGATPFPHSLCWQAYIEFCAGGASPPSG